MDKKIELKMTGEQTELDKTVMEKIGDPLVHLVRNSLDHGIESPEVRLAAGKSEVGTINLNAYHQGGFIIIEIIDDGAGLPKDNCLLEVVEGDGGKAGILVDDLLSQQQVVIKSLEPNYRRLQGDIGCHNFGGWYSCTDSGYVGFISFGQRD